MCRPTFDGGHASASRSRLHVRAFYLRLSLSSPQPHADHHRRLSLRYLPAIGGVALELNGRGLPAASPAQVPLRRVGPGPGPGDDAAYASADHVCAAEGARFEVYAGGELAADGVFNRRGGGGWRVECRRAGSAVAVAEVLVLAKGGALMRAKARASTWGLGCGTRLEGIPEEAPAEMEMCACVCGEEWEVVGADGDEWKEEEELEMEMETVRWALEMGAWAMCVGVGLLATARSFRRKRAFL